MQNLSKVTITLLLSVLMPSTISASKIESRTLDIPEYENRTTRNTVQAQEAATLISMEEEMRSMAGRIELLEHEITLLKEKLGATPVPNAMPTPLPEQPVASKEKVVDDEPTEPLVIKKAPSKAPTEENFIPEGEAPAATPEAKKLYSKYDEAATNKFLADNAIATPSSSAPQTAQTTSSSSTERTSYELALAAFKEKKYAVAQEKLEEFIAQHKNSSLLPNAYFWLGESFYRQNSNENAAVNYLKSYKAAPKGNKAADSLLMVSFALQNLGKKQEACGMLERLEQEFPKRSTSSIKKSNDAKLKFGCK